MRYIVKKVKDGYEFTHIEEKETITGDKVEVIKGRNILKEEEIITAIERLQETYKETEKLLEPEELEKKFADYKEEIQCDLDLYKQQLADLDKFIEEINKIKQD